MGNPFAAAAQLRLEREDGGHPSAFAFAGAQQSRLTADWLTSTQSADSAVRQGMRTLRNRSREMVGNNSHFARFTGLCEENIVGADGILTQARVGEQAGKLNREANTELERGWREWSEAEHASADGMLCREEIEQLCARTVPQDGEVLVRMLPGFRNRFGFALQVLDADQLDETYDDGAGGDGEDSTRMGITQDRWGRPKVYHVWSDHPYDYQGGRRRTRRVPVPAEDIVHLYIPGRPGAGRGLPWFTPVLLDARMLRGYREAELIAARTAAAKMGFFVQEGDHVAVTPGAKEPARMQADPGRLERLPPGWRFEAWDPQHPTSAFPQFDKAILRSVASGIRTYYNTLAGDLEGVSFSSIRQGELKERDVWKLLQGWMIRRFHRRVYRRWLTYALTAGAIRLPSYNPAEWMEARHRGRRWPWVDPLKDILARRGELEIGVTSLSMICADLGYDFEDVLIDRARERALMEEYGVEIRTEGGKLVVVYHDTESDGGSGEEQEGRALRLAQGA